MSVIVYSIDDLMKLRGNKLNINTKLMKKSKSKKFKHNKGQNEATSPAEFFVCGSRYQHN